MNESNIIPFKYKTRFPYHRFSYKSFPSSILVSGRELSGSGGFTDTPELESSAVNMRDVISILDYINEEAKRKKFNLYI